MVVLFRYIKHSKKMMKKKKNRRKQYNKNDYIDEIAVRRTKKKCAER